VRQLAAELNPTAEISATVIKVQTGATTLRTATGATILSAQADATLVPDQESRINATFQLDLPAMATQPVFAAAGIVSAGRMGGEVRAAIGPHGVTGSSPGPPVSRCPLPTSACARWSRPTAP
jgi:hypothetical protein